jgi:IclR family transcriptional regulator, KDG regulon repressor
LTRAAAFQENKTLHNLAQILSLFSTSQTDEKSVSEISKSLGMYPSKISRMLATLERDGLMEKNIESGKYRIGIRFLELGMIYISNFPLRKIVRPHLEQMAKETNLTASMAILRGTRIIIVDRIQNLNLDIVMQSMGINSPLHSTSVGKVFLASLTGKSQKEILRNVNFVKYTETTIVDLKSLLDHLRVVKEKGYATDEGETYEDLNCIAAPIKDESGKVIAAINLMGRKAMISSNDLFKLSGYLKERAFFISRQVGFQASIW